MLIQLINTDPEVVNPKEKIIKKSEKAGLFTALDLGAVWLERELKSNTTKKKQGVFITLLFIFTTLENLV